MLGDGEAKVKVDELTWAFWGKDREPQKQTPKLFKGGQNS